MIRKMSKFQVFYLVIFVITVFILSAGTTYAYWAATTSSTQESLQAQSTIYSINMEILPLYSDFSFIPMNDEDAVKALKNKCLDKYGRGACSAYKMRVFGYSDTLGFVSGYMDVKTNNMTNLSYMVYRESETFTEGSCVELEGKNYCVALEAKPMGDGVGLTLGDKYDVFGTDSVEFIILIWLTNLETSQNKFDIGSFTGIVTMQAGNGGEIKGTISSAVIPRDDTFEENMEG